MIVEIKDEAGARLEQASLRDLSANGAMLHVNSGELLPEAVNLYFSAERMYKSGRVRWREEQFIGIEFDDPFDIPERMRSRRDRLDVVTSHFEKAGFDTQTKGREHLANSG